MSLGAIGAFLIVLIAVFVFGNLWFNIVESVLDKIKRILFRRKSPQIWHTLPTEDEDKF